MHPRHPWAAARIATAVTFLTFAVGTSVAIAQSSTLVAGDALFSSGNGPACASAVGAAARVTSHGASIVLLPEPLTSASAFRSPTPAVVLSYSTPSARRWRASAEAAVGPANSDCAMLSAYSRGLVRISRALGAAGIQLSYGIRGLASIDPARDQEGMSVGLWRDIVGARFTFDVRAHSQTWQSRNYSSHTIQRPDSGRDSLSGDYVHYSRTLTVGDSSVARSSARSFDVRTRMQWGRGRVHFDLVAGGTAGTVERVVSPFGLSDSLSASARIRRSDPLVFRTWGRADMRLAATSSLDLLAGIASLPAQPVFGSSSRRVLSAGASLKGLPFGTNTRESTKREAAALFQVLRVDSARVIVRFHLTSAHEVELTGEPTAWAPVLMEKSAGDWWEASLQARPGSYRMNIRVNGATWVAPPGVPTVRDEFGAETGLVIIR